MPAPHLVLLIASLFLLSACERTVTPVPPDPEPEPDLSVSLSASVTEGPAPLEVTFEAEATGYTPDYRWDFGDGSEILFDSAVQTHVYETAGTYTASVRVGGSEDYDEDTVTVTVTQ